MAVRLSVIMVHSTPPTAIAQQLAQRVVGELIGLTGIDLTLVAPVGQLSESSTDRLTLASLSGDVAVLDWQRPEEILGSLERIGFDGKRCPHLHDLGVPAPPANSRRIYAYDLSKFSSAEEVIDSLSRLNADRQVRAFQLGPPPSSLASASSQGITSSQGTPPSNGLGKNVHLPNHLQAASTSVPEPAGGEPLTDPKVLPESVQPPSTATARQLESETPLDLDDLLDQLDRSDT